MHFGALFVKTCNYLKPLGWSYLVVLKINYNYQSTSPISLYQKFLIFILTNYLILLNLTNEILILY